jgi:hypothetical protein
MSKTLPKGTRPGKNGGTLNTGGGGRPKGAVSITTEIKRLLAADKGKQVKILAQALLIQAAKGNGTAIREIMGRIDGPLGETVDHSGEVVIRVERIESPYPDASSGADEDLSGSEDV